MALVPEGAAAVLLAVGLLLLAARALGELARRLRQPAVVGEIAAGILLGPTVLGALAPELHRRLLPPSGPVADAFDGISSLAVALFLLAAGLEVDLSSARRQGRRALVVATTSLVVPGTLGFLLGRALPGAAGPLAEDGPTVFALFVAVAFAISALPVIAKILIDLDLYRTDFGVLVVTTAAIQDLVGWGLFALLLGLMGAGASAGGALAASVLPLAFAVLVLTLGRRLLDRALPWVQERTHWPSGVLGFALALALIGAATAEALGAHAVFGAFLVGVALGDSRHLRRQARTTIEEFVSSFFTPLFFASIGLRLDFVAHFDLPLVLALLAVGSAGKLGGGYLGARWTGLGRGEALATGAALNARGAMEIVLGLVALAAGLVTPSFFVALVVLALVTSIASGPIVRLALRDRVRPGIEDVLARAPTLRDLRASERVEVLRALADAAAEAGGLDRAAVEAAVLAREGEASTGVENGLALPHARLAGLRAPIVAVATSRGGVDFDAPDGRLARLVVLVLTAPEDHAGHLALLGGLARAFREPGAVERVVAANGSLSTAVREAVRAA